MDLHINEMFFSFSGEVGGIRQGHPCMILRLQGCNLSCPWCDAPGTSQEGYGAYFDTRIIAKIIAETDLPILITGGEPLLQQEAILEMLVYAVHYGFNQIVQIETNGTQVLDEHLLNVACMVVDFKVTYEHLMLTMELDKLKSKDWVKGLVTKEEEIDLFLELSRNWLDKPRIQNPQFAISTTDKELYPVICKKVLDSELPIIVNVQIHRYLSVR